MKKERKSFPVAVTLYKADIAALDTLAKRYGMGRSATVRLLLQREITRLVQSKEAMKLEVGNEYNL